MISETGFHFQEGELYCEDIEIGQLFKSFPRQRHQITIRDKNILTDVPATPAYVYSAAALKKNVESYVRAMETCDLKGVLGYAVKANGNLNILKALKSFGVKMLVTVSGNEILAGLKAGFDPNKILLNGNGKQCWEIKLAIEQGVLLNVDSIFDAKRIANIAANEFEDKTGTRTFTTFSKWGKWRRPQQKDLASLQDHLVFVRVFLRLRPTSNECDVGVHPFVNTSDKSKFGFELSELDQILECLNEAKSINVVGIHCHLGSCISNPEVYSYLGTFVSHVDSELKQRGIHVEFLDVGGGVGIDYHKVPSGYKMFSENGHKEEIKSHGIEEFMRALAHVVPKDLSILVEPGRSLVGDTGILVTKVLGSKEVQGKHYMIVDAAMSELIRPCLYGSHHQIFPTKMNENEYSEWSEYDVVGPICESADFLGKNVPFQSQPDYIAIMDCGAYGASMSSTYNMRPKASEVLVTGTEWECIRRRDMFDDLVTKYL